MLLQCIISYYIFFQILYYIILYIPTVSDSTCQAASDSAMTMPGDAATPDWPCWCLCFQRGKSLQVPSGNLM